MTSDAPFRGTAVASCGWTPPGSPTKPPDPNPCCSFWREAGRWVEIKHGAEGGKHWAPAFPSCKQGWEDAYPATLTLQLPQKMNQSVLGSSEFTGQFSLSNTEKDCRKTRNFPLHHKVAHGPQDLEGATHQLCHILAPE